MSAPQLVLRRTALLFISFAIALFYLEHDVAGAEYSVDVAAVVVDLVAYLDVGDGAVGAEGLEGAGVWSFCMTSWPSRRLSMMSSSMSLSHSAGERSSRLMAPIASSSRWMNGH